MGKYTWAFVSIFEIANIYNKINGMNSKAAKTKVEKISGCFKAGNKTFLNFDLVEILNQRSIR